MGKDLESKISDLNHHLHSPVGEYYTIQSMLQYETDHQIAKVKGHHPSGMKSLLHLHQAFEFIIEFKRIMVPSQPDAYSSQIAMEVYGQTLSKYHPWLLQKVAALSVKALPNRSVLINQSINLISIAPVSPA